MTIPAMPMPGQQPASGGWQQMGGGYQPQGPGMPASQPAPQPQYQQPMPPMPSAMQQPAQPVYTPQPIVPMPMDQGRGYDPRMAQHIAQQMQPQPPVQQQQQPQFQPQPQYQAPTQPQFQPQPQFQAPVQPQPQGVDANMRLYGPNIPAEMQGRTMGELMATYDGMKRVALQTISNAEPRQQQQQPGAPVQSQPQGQQPSAQAPQPFDWRNPAASIAPVVRQIIGEEIAPVRQLATSVQVSNAEQQVANEIGQATFAQLRPLLYQQLAGADPAVLANPNTWRVASRALIGEMALQASRMGGQQPQGGQPQVPGTFQPQQIPQGAQPIPNIGSFFTEQPGQGGQGTQAPPALTQTELYYAQQMGQTAEQYYAWKYGRPLPQAQPQGFWGNAR